MDTREMHWLEMMKWYGTTEVPGPVDNPVIVGWFAELGFPGQTDETAWCSVVTNITAKRAGLEYSGKLDARSWMKIGSPVTEPKVGHVVVFYRNGMSGWQGHVGLFAGYSKTRTGIFTLGGNQGNTLCIREYPLLTPEFGLLGFRELKLH